MRVHLYDPLHPAILRLLAVAIDGANKARVPIAVCGEMAGEVDLTRLLLGLGLRRLSMHPSHLLTIKQRVLTTDLGAIKPVVERIRRTDDPAKLASLLEKLNA
jgi:phosphotransferase system enzyme I (PtsI)